MKWWHWFLLIAAVGILAAESAIVGNPNLPGQIAWIYGLEVTYFIVLGCLGISLGRLMQGRLLAREDNDEYARSVPRYRLLAWLFVLASITYLLTGWLPGWIGRHIIFLGGYYWGMSRYRREAK